MTSCFDRFYTCAVTDMADVTDVIDVIDVTDVTDVTRRRAPPRAAPPPSSIHCLTTRYNAAH